MISHGLSASEAAEKYITLAVGDALVAQVPALLLSIAAAVIVTRVSDSRDLAGQIGGQFANPATWLPVAVVLGGIGMIPAMPQTVFLPAAGLAFWLYRKLKQRADRPESVVDVLPPPDPQQIVLDDVSDHTLVTIELGYGVVHLVDERRGSPLVSRITGVRKQLSQMFGFIVPQFRVRDALEMPPHDYAKMRVRGAMVDLIRRSVPLSRGASERRRHLRGQEDALRGQLGRDPTPAELAAALEITAGELADLRAGSEPLRFESIDEAYSDSDMAFADGEANVLDRLADSELRGQVAEAIAALPERLQLVVQLYFVEELNLSEIAGVLEVSIPRVHQLKAQALEQLRKALSGVADIL